MKVKIVSWNIAGGRPIKFLNRFSYQNENLNYFVQELKKVKPDIVCLQETHSNKTRSIVREIADQLEFKHVFDLPSSPSHIDENYQLGISIISTMPFSDAVNYKYPPPILPLENEKVVEVHAKTVQAVKMNDFWVANTQVFPVELFGYTYDTGPGVRYSRQIEGVLLKLKIPLLFCADFNFDNPAKIYPEFMKSKYLSDALQGLDTRPVKSGKNQRRDHILYSQEFKLNSSGVVKTNTDHYLCWAEFEYPGE